MSFEVGKVEEVVEVDEVVEVCGCCGCCGRLWLEVVEVLVEVGSFWKSLKSLKLKWFEVVEVC